VIRIWSLVGEEIQVLRGHQHFVNTLDWSPDGTRIASGSRDRTIRLWDPTGTPGPVFRTNGEVLSVSWSPDGKRLLSGDRNCGIVLWDPEAEEPVWNALLLREGNYATFSLAGEVLHGDPEVIEEELVYLVEKPSGAMELLKPSEFQKRTKTPALPGEATPDADSTRPAAEEKPSESTPTQAGAGEPSATP